MDKRQKDFLLRWVVLPALVCFVIIPLSAYAYFRYHYYDEFNYVRARLESMPGVTLVALDANEDFTLEDIAATVEVKGKGRISFYNISRDSFEAVDHLVISQIGHRRPYIAGFGFGHAVEIETGRPMKTDFWREMIDVGLKAKEPRVLPRGVKNIQEAIARYDAIEQGLRAWPPCPTQKRLVDKQGAVYDYCVLSGNERPDKLFPNHPWNTLINR